MERPHRLAFLFALVTGTAFADAPSTELIFSDRYQGALACSAVSPTLETDMQAAVYSEPYAHSRLPEPRKLVTACLTGGGDCGCEVLYKAQAPGVSGKDFFRVKDEAGQEAWVLAPAAEAVSLITIAGAREGAVGNELGLRLPAFEDRALQRRVEYLDAIPTAVLAKIRAELPTRQGMLAMPKTEDLAQLETVLTITSPDGGGEALRLSAKDLFKAGGRALRRDAATGAEVLEAELLERRDGRLLVAAWFEGGAPTLGKYGRGCSAPRYFWLEPGMLPYRVVPPEDGGAEASLSPLLDETQYVYAGPDTIAGQAYAMFDVELVLADPRHLDANDASQVAERRYHLRRVWISLLDGEGRPGFWLSYVPC